MGLEIYSLIVFYSFYFGHVMDCTFLTYAFDGILSCFSPLQYIFGHVSQCRTDKGQGIGLDGLCIIVLVFFYADDVNKVSEVKDEWISYYNV